MCRQFGIINHQYQCKMYSSHTSTEITKSLSRTLSALMTIRKISCPATKVLETGEKHSCCGRERFAQEYHSGASLSPVKFESISVTVSPFHCKVEEVVAYAHAVYGVRCYGVWADAACVEELGCAGVDSWPPYSPDPQPRQARSYGSGLGCRKMRSRPKPRGTIGRRVIKFWWAVRLS